jgi:two-component system heavy metal sensor histidine kinase CusS
VSEIRTITEITLSRLRDPEEYRQALGDTLESARSLQGLIEKLLILARLEAGQMPPELDAIAVKPMLAQYWASVSNAASRRRLVFEDRCEPDMMVTADPKLLAVVLSNALSNAVTYTPEEGCITVETRSTDRTCALVIANTGCELSQEDVARAFDRFWRADVSRANRRGLNCGLGLTLVRRAMEVVGGKAEASVSEDRRFVLTLTFVAPDRDG